MPGVPTYDELVLVANEDALERDGGTIRAFIGALSRGRARPEGRPGRGDRRPAEGEPGPRPRPPAGALKVTLPLFSPPKGKPYGYQDPGEWNRFADWMTENNLLENTPDARNSYTNALLPGAGPASALRGPARPS